MNTLLEIEDLTLTFETFAGSVHALESLSLRMKRGEFFGLVGESGCGKSATALSLLRLHPTPPARYVRGRIVLYPSEGPPLDILSLSEEDLYKVRGRLVGMIFQEPMTSLNPVLSIGDQIVEALLEHDVVGDPPSRWERMFERRGLRITRRLRSRAQKARREAQELLRKVGLPDPSDTLDRYPHELSGGQRQRAMIAQALACRPELLVADEPTTALDTTIQAQILELFRDLRRSFSSSLLLITHHLGVVAELCDRVGVMYAGSLVESAPTKDLFRIPLHPYTRGLLRSIPDEGSEKGRLPAIVGSVPDLLDPPPGCRFHPRCEYALPICRLTNPPLYEVTPGHLVACVHFEPGRTPPSDLVTPRGGVG